MWWMIKNNMEWNGAIATTPKTLDHINRVKWTKVSDINLSKLNFRLKNQMSPKGFTNAPRSPVAS